MDRATEYVYQNVKDSDDIYSLAIAAYELQLAGHSGKDEILSKLNARANVDSDKVWWSKPIPPSDSSNIWYGKPNSVNVEMSSYGLLANLMKGDISKCLSIMKWLLKQQNENGGFESTQDTCVGLQALAAIGEKISAKDTNIDLTISYGDKSTELNVNENNSLILQVVEIPSKTRSVNVTGSGHGFSLATISYQYNLLASGPSPRFEVEPIVNVESTLDNLSLTVHTR